MDIPNYKIHQIIDYFSQRLAQTGIAPDTPRDRLIRRPLDPSQLPDFIGRISMTVIHEYERRISKDS